MGVWEERGKEGKRERGTEKDDRRDIHIMMLAQRTEIFIQFLDALFVRLDAFLSEAVFELGCCVSAESSIVGYIYRPVCYA